MGTTKMRVDRECGRCAKTKTLEVTMAEAQELIEEDEVKTSAIADLEAYAEKLDVKVNPEVIILHRLGDDPEKFQVDTLDNLCENPQNAKRHRGCKPRVRDLIDDICARLERTPSEKKTKRKEKKPKPGPTEGEGGEK